MRTNRVPFTRETQDFDPHQVISKNVKDQPFPLDLSGPCEALRTPTPPWTFSLPRQMMHATPDCRRAVMDIVVWLRSLGLGKYEAAFRENGIDETVLPSLT